jgi:hypothetical protein
MVDMETCWEKNLEVFKGKTPMCITALIYYFS